MIYPEAAARPRERVLRELLWLCGKPRGERGAVDVRNPVVFGDPGREVAPEHDDWVHPSDLRGGEQAPHIGSVALNAARQRDARAPCVSIVLAPTQSESAVLEKRLTGEALRLE